MFGFAGCCVLMSKKTTNWALIFLNQPIFELQEREIKLALENVAGDDCSMYPPPKPPGLIQLFGVLLFAVTLFH
jgi:hypothetical protein